MFCKTKYQQITTSCCKYLLFLIYTVETLIFATEFVYVSDMTHETSVPWNDLIFKLDFTSLSSFLNLMSNMMRDNTGVL